MHHFQEWSHIHLTASALFCVKIPLGCNIVFFYTSFHLSDSLPASLISQNCNPQMTIKLWAKGQKPLQNVSVVQHDGNYLVFQSVETWVSESDFKVKK